MTVTVVLNNVTSCSLADIYYRFRGTSLLKFLQHALILSLFFFVLIKDYFLFSL
jgi:hypothetical protein